MSEAPHSLGEEVVVTGQLGRVPREPWRVAVRCRYGYPSVIASPAILADGTPFPTLYWLTCPWIASGASAGESAGATARWAEAARSDESLEAALRAVDREFRRLRAEEGAADERCEGTGIAGQTDPLGVKCLHAHAALFLAGLADPIGADVVGRTGRACPDERCRKYATEGVAP